MSKLLSIIFLAVLFSCADEQKQVKQEVDALSNHKTTYGNKPFKLPIFTLDAKKQVEKWVVFEDFEIALNNLTNSSLDGLQNKTDRLLIFTDSLTKVIPDTLNQKAIYARLLVAKTRVALLHQEVRKSRVDSIKIEEYIKQVYKASNNFVLQINEKFDKEAIDVERIEAEEKEKQKQKRFLDSVYQAELNDKID